MRTIDKILVGVWISLAVITASELAVSIIEGGGFEQYLIELLLIGVILTMCFRLDWAYKDKEASDAALIVAEALIERYREIVRMLERHDDKGEE